MGARDSMRGESCLDNRDKIPSEAEFDAVKDERFSPHIYEKLRNSKVAIAGLGGLGSHIAVMLARSGVGQLHLVDFDIVDLSNLNRQVYTVDELGMPKTEGLKRILLKINPYINVSYENIKVDNENIKQLFTGFNIVCEAFDNPSAKAMIVSELLSRDSETIIVSGSGMAGYGDANEIKTEKKFSRLYVCGDGKSDAFEGIGLMAPRVMICAGHQANMIVRLILGEE